MGETGAELAGVVGDYGKVVDGMKEDHLNGLIFWVTFGRVVLRFQVQYLIFLKNTLKRRREARKVRIGGNRRRALLRVEGTDGEILDRMKEDRMKCRLLANITF